MHSPGTKDSPHHRTPTRPRLESQPRFAIGVPGSEGRAFPTTATATPIQRSALAIKGLTYMPTGATVAALTTSLPETPGGERNWDYRYTWMRDATFMLQALHWLNLDWEADEFMQFVADVKPTEDGSLQIMYGIDGRRQLPESTRDDLSGYAGARPVRVGNAAFSQRQNDVFGAVLDSILFTPGGTAPAAPALADRRVAGGVRHPCLARPRSGHLGGSRQATALRVVQVDVLGRAGPGERAGGDSRDPKLAATWRATADEIQADVLAHGISDRGVLRQHYETDALDASTLLAGSFGFLAHDDKRLRNTVLAVAEELTENGFVLRYRTDETDDGLSGKEGTFLICSFWLVSAFAIIGEMQRARDLMERLLRIASPLGLYAEEYDPETGRHLGNFPQAFSHLALIEAAARMIVLERLAGFDNGGVTTQTGTSVGGARPGTTAFGQVRRLLERADTPLRELPLTSARLHEGLDRSGRVCIQDDTSGSVGMRCTSALNAGCRAQLDNLYIGDTSVFPRVGSAQRWPTHSASATHLPAGLTRGER